MIQGEWYTILVFEPSKYTKFKNHTNLTQRIVVPAINGDNLTLFADLSLKMSDYAMYAPQRRNKTFMDLLSWYANKKI